MEGVPVSVGKREVRPQHQLAVRARVDTYVLTESLAQEVPQGVRIKSHRPSLGWSG